MLYDVFISHAWEDKEDFVRELAERLQSLRIEVWYDEFSLKVGDGLRRSIDIGLSKSRFGIVILSKNFFNKQWTNWELNGLVQRQNSSDYNLIIPIWHNIDKSEILEYSPSLADKVAIKSEKGIDYVVQQIESITNPQGSTLIVARDFLLKSGYQPPVITDDWWLDVLEYCGKEWGGLEYLSFPIKWNGWSPKDRGENIARNALQMLWQKEAEESGISQLSHPSEVIEFIETQPGLKDACIKDTKQTALYFPQLTIKGFGDFLEPQFEDLLKTGNKYNTNFECEEEIALRHPLFGHYEPSELADFYFTGAGDGFGPSTQQYDYIDCIIWLLSDKSLWLPVNVRNVLLQGLKNWGVWNWDKNRNVSNFENNSTTGTLAHAMLEAIEGNQFKLTKEIEQDIKTRIEHSKAILYLPEPIDDLYKIFIDKKIIESWISVHQGYKKRREER